MLAGGLTDGGNGVTKTGQGTLVLGPSAGTFTGPLNINGGFVQVGDPAGLTTGTTTIGVGTTPATLDLNGQALTTTGSIILNGGAGPAAKSSATPAGLYNSSATTASFGGNLEIGAAIATVNATIGGFGNIDLSNATITDSVAGSALNKVGPDTLLLGGPGNTFTGQFNIVAGLVELTNPNGFTSSVTNPVVVSNLAAVDLNGQAVTTLKPLQLTGAGETAAGSGQGTPNTLGALIDSSAAAASYAGPIALNGTTSIGGPSLTAGVNGGITLSGAVTGAQEVIKIGANNLTFTNGGDTFTFFDTQGGSVTFSGAGALSTQNQASFARAGTSLTFDNTGTAVSNRGGGRGYWLSGSFTILGNATTAVTELTQPGRQ